MSRSDQLDLLHRCQNGDASCLYTLKKFETYIDLVVERELAKQNDPDRHN